jgi:hypothetical protein
MLAAKCKSHVFEFFYLFLLPLLFLQHIYNHNVSKPYSFPLLDRFSPVHNDEYGLNKFGNVMAKATQGRECEHNCAGRKCCNPTSGLNSWKFGSGGSHVPHMKSVTKHPQCSKTCPAYSYIVRSVTVKETPQPSNVESRAFSKVFDTPQSPYRLLVVFSVEHRLDKLSDPDAPSTNWTRTEVNPATAHQLLGDPSIAGFVAGPIIDVRQGVVSIRIHDRARVSFNSRVTRSMLTLTLPFSSCS